MTQTTANSFFFFLYFRLYTAPPLLATILSSSQRNIKIARLIIDNTSSICSVVGIEKYHWKNITVVFQLLCKSEKLSRACFWSGQKLYTRLRNLSTMFDLLKRNFHISQNNKFLKEFENGQRWKGLAACAGSIVISNHRNTRYIPYEYHD